MNRTRHRIVLTAVLTLVSAASVSAGPHAIGGSFSLNGAGAAYRHALQKDVFYELGIELDYSHSVFVSRTMPGVRARFGYNVVFSERKYDDGTLRCYGGPGVELGYLKDAFSSKEGLAGGLTGTVGLEYEFRLPVILSLSVTPCLGFLLSGKAGAQHMDFYLGGMTYAFIPAIGIKYSF